MLACADCPGIDVTIVLKPDHTFNETREYIDRNSRFVQDGTYSIRNNILILKSTDTEEYYLLENNTIRKLNQNRKPIIGPTADSYIFKKVN